MDGIKNLTAEASVPQKRVMHLDINAYFATVLQQENPALRGKPVGVLKSAGRSCVIAASKEAKALGVKTGELLSEARRKAPDLITVPAQFDVYLSCTHALKKLFTQVAPTVDFFSLDEAFFDMTDCRTFAPDLITYGKHLQERVKNTLGEWVTCNVGIAWNKLLAKMTSEVSPKGSVTEVTDENLDQLLASTPFSSVCGVGHRLEKRLQRLGVHTPLMINLIDDETLEQSFGPFWSKQLRLIGLGQEPHFFTHERQVPHMQSVGRTITGYRLEDNEDAIKRVVLNLLEEATYKVRNMQLAGRKVGIALWGHDQFWSAHRTLKYWVQHTAEIFPIIYDELYRPWRRSFPIIKFGVWVSGLQPLVTVQPSLLPEAAKRERVSRALDAVNDRFGRFTLMPAALLGGPVIRPEVTGFLGDKLYHGL
ncbi:hypothetical protein KBC79_06800 [Candidatus Woesebacteria bacterium]|nr:hypothetical protein [Candidatus Woesebacteria bacterium]